MSSLPTPLYSLAHYRSVYDPAEDTFLLLDALERDKDLLKSTFNHPFVLELGCGSGVVTSFVNNLFEPQKCVSICADINPQAAACTLNTASLNRCQENVNPIISDLCFPLLPQLINKIDILIFNPPYVPTIELENIDLIDRAFAGGNQGIEVLQRIQKAIPSLLTEQGVFYLVAIKENNIDYLTSKFLPILKSEIVLQRRCGREHLFVIKYSRI